MDLSDALTPILIFESNSKGISLLASVNNFFWSEENPVVPMVIGFLSFDKLLLH